MECSLSDCNEEAKHTLCWGMSKGSIPMCSGCLESYFEHTKAREKYFQDKQEEFLFINKKN